MEALCGLFLVPDDHVHCVAVAETAGAAGIRRPHPEFISGGIKRDWTAWFYENCVVGFSSVPVSNDPFETVVAVKLESLWENKLKNLRMKCYLFQSVCYMKTQILNVSNTLERVIFSKAQILQHITYNWTLFQFTVQILLSGNSRHRNQGTHPPHSLSAFLQAHSRTQLDSE